VAKREVMLMGGPEKVLELADQALQSNDTRWAIHLLAKLQDSGLASDELAKLLSEKLVESYRALAQTISNTNGRAYLLESALELSQDMPEPQSPKISEKMASSIPLETIFSHMAVRLNPEKSSNIHESVHFVFPDENKRFVVTVRNGIAEIVEGEPLPGTPEPVAIISADSQTYRMVAMDMSSPVSAYASGKITIEGSWPGFLKFMSRFQTAGD
jgi:alkyl sulfatase BDS1-like metallo-beta-lactamase superfamily hydrolase